MNAITRIAFLSLTRTGAAFEARPGKDFQEKSKLALQTLKNVIDKNPDIDPRVLAKAINAKKAA